jgi:hypothetical protein
VLNPAIRFNNSSTFFVQNVIDERSRQSLETINNRQLFLKPSAATAIQEFMDVCFPEKNGLTPIIIKINAIEIQQKQTDLSEVTARVHLDLTIFRKNETGLEVLYEIRHNEDQIFDEFSDKKIRETHEMRIRAGLEYCMRSFIYHTQANKVKASPFIEINSNSSDELTKWINILSFKKVFSNKVEGYKISYTGFADSENDIIIPFIFTYDQTFLKPDILENQNLKSVDTYCLSGGFDVYLKILPVLYLRTGAEIPIGLEISYDLNDKRKSNFLTGIHLKEGIQIIPWQDLGITFGVCFFQKYQTSSVYKVNIGLEAEVGVNF